VDPVGCINPIVLAGTRVLGARGRSVAGSVDQGGAGAGVVAVRAVGAGDGARAGGAGTICAAKSANDGQEGTAEPEWPVGASARMREHRLALPGRSFRIAVRNSGCRVRWFRSRMAPRCQVRQ
jgi:hypothetical protein